MTALRAALALLLVLISANSVLAQACLPSTTAMQSSITPAPDGFLDIYQVATDTSASLNGISISRSAAFPPTTSEVVGLTNLGHTNPGQPMWRLDFGTSVSTITFSRPINNNYVIGFNDVDYAALAVITAFDPSGAPLNTSGWTYENGQIGNRSIVTIGAGSVTVSGDGNAASDPVVILRPTPGQLVGSITVNYSGDAGYGNIYFGHLRICEDHTDTPASYQDAQSNIAAAGPTLGAANTNENGPNFSAAANADGGDDGITSLAVLPSNATSYTVPAANISAAGSGTLHAWIDFDGSGTFQPAEYAAVNVAGGVASGNLSWSGITVGATGTTIARFWLTSDSAITASSQLAHSLNGEIEDYQITISVAPTAVDDSSSGNPAGMPVTVSALGNDSAATGRSLDPASVTIAGAGGPGQPLVVPGEGTWSVNTTTGDITFTPLAGFAGNPTPITYTVADDLGNVSNTATVTIGYVPPGLTLSVAVASVTDTNGNGINDPGDVINYSFTVTNTGTTALSGVTISGTSLPMPGLACTPVSLPAGASATLTCTSATYTIQPADAGTSIALNATATGSNGFGVTVSSAASVALAVTSTSMTIKKTAGVKTVRQGQMAPFTIEVTNPSTSVAATVNVTDKLPAGLAYRTGTSQVGGTATEPTVNGQMLTWTAVSVPAGATVQITLGAAVLSSAKPGPLTNRANVTEPVTGSRLSPEATATVILEADPVFDCGTVIGQVFNDINQDGYMNPPKDGQVTVAGLNRSENGIAGVRLVTVRGTFITTDRHGRFHVPCADLPRDIGSNYMLKLDERTLPRGYRMTTENPRVVRLTAGKMTELNFGATLSRIVRLDISAAAFVDGEPKEALRKGLRQLVDQIKGTPSTLRITYVAEGEDAKTARKQIRRTEKLIGKLWANQGKYLLNIEEKIVSRRAGN